MHYFYVAYDSGPLQGALAVQTDKAHMPLTWLCDHLKAKHALSFVRVTFWAEIPESEYRRWSGLPDEEAPPPAKAKVKGKRRAAKHLALVGADKTPASPGGKRPTS